MGRLTDSQLRQWMAAGVPITGKADGGGLTFTLSAKGTAAWTLRYRIAGQRKELTLGRYPELSLAEARQMAAAARQRIAGGWDVAAEKAAARWATGRRTRFAEMEREIQSCESALEIVCTRLKAVRLDLRREEERARYE
jgi:hypothetical protein